MSLSLHTSRDRDVLYRRWSGQIYVWSMAIYKESRRSTIEREVDDGGMVGMSEDAINTVDI